MSAPLSSSSYPPSHPWFYVLGGVPLTPKQILAQVRTTKYRGYNKDDIAVANGRCEPRRSQDLRRFRSLALARLRKDLSGYRHAVFGLRQFSGTEVECADVHVAVSLKHNHVYNELAHLAWLDELLLEQPDFFEC